MIAVTGPTGHVGMNLIHELLGRERAVRALIYEPSRVLDALPVEQVRGDITDLESLVSAFAGAEAVFHLAARIDLTRRHRDLCERINVEGTRNVVEACRRAGVRRLVYFSSIHAVSPYPLSEPIDETRELASEPYLGIYDETKARAARLVLEACGSGLDAVILHPTGIIGPVDYQPSRMGKTLIEFAKGRIPMVIEGGFSWVDVRDVAHAAANAETKGRSGERYIVAGHWKTMSDVARTTAEIAGVRAPRGALSRRAALGLALFPELVAAVRGGEPRFSRYSIQALAHHQLIDASKSRATLQYEPRPFETTIRETLEWHRAHGNL